MQLWTETSRLSYQTLMPCGALNLSNNMAQWDILLLLVGICLNSKIEWYLMCCDTRKLYRSPNSPIAQEQAN